MIEILTNNVLTENTKSTSRKDIVLVIKAFTVLLFLGKFSTKVCIASRKF